MKKKLIITLFSVFTLLPAYGFSGKSEGKTVIAVSIVPQKTFVEAVCGKNADVVVMIPPGQSPGNYEPTPKQMEKFSKAGIYFAIGVPAEKTNIMPRARELNGIKIVNLQEKTAKEFPDREFSPGNRDPHIWLSIKRAGTIVKVIGEEMGLIDPDNKDKYKKNALQYIAELEKVDREIKKALQGVKNRKFIVFHPAFGYLADDYNLEMYALEKDGKEATPQRLKKMIDFAKKENIKIIFYQAEISSRQAQSFAEEIGGKTIQLAPLSPDYINNLKKMAELMAKVMK